MKFNPTASSRMRTCPGPAVGVDRSTTSRTSGPPACRAWIASISCTSSLEARSVGSSQMFSEERQRSFARLGGVGGVVVLSALAREGVVPAGVGVKLDLRVVLQGGQDQRLGRFGHELVL